MVLEFLNCFSSWLSVSLFLDRQAAGNRQSFGKSMHEFKDAVNMDTPKTVVVKAEGTEGKTEGTKK